mgnify:CR=1 FL=1
MICPKGIAHDLSTCLVGLFGMWGEAIYKTKKRHLRGKKKERRTK